MRSWQKEKNFNKRRFRYPVAKAPGLKIKYTGRYQFVGAWARSGYPRGMIPVVGFSDAGFSDRYSYASGEHGKQLCS